MPSDNDATVKLNEAVIMQKIVEDGSSAESADPENPPIGGPRSRLELYEPYFRRRRAEWEAKRERRQFPKG
jgi:hypothetical protein